MAWFSDRSSSAAATSRGVFCGYKIDKKTKRRGEAILYTEDAHGLVIGSTGTGKTARFLLNNALAENLDGEALLLIDIKAELAAVSALIHYDRKEKVYIIDPFGALLDLIKDHPDPEFKRLIRLGLAESVGFDPLAIIDRNSPNFYDDCAALSEALIQLNSSAESHWPESAQGMLTGLLMWEIVRQLLPNAPDRPSLPNVRAMLTASEKMEASKADPTKLVATSGLHHTAQFIVDAHAEAAAMELRGEHPFIAAAVLEIIASLMSKFIKDTREISSIQSTADTQTRWMLSPPIAADLKKIGRDFRDLKKGRTVCYVILPSDRLRTHGTWLRVIISTAIRRLSIRGGAKTRVFIDEMPALGRLPALSDAYAQVRGYRVCLIGIIQDINQLSGLYKEFYESFAANAGFTICLRPNDTPTGEWISRRAGQEYVLMTSDTQSGLAYRVDLDKQTAGTSGNFTLRARLLPQDLFSLPPGIAVCFQAGSGDFEFVELPLYLNNPAVKKFLPNPLHED